MVKLWDLSAGVQVATSRLQPAAVRALALDANMLVASASNVSLCCSMLCALPMPFCWRTA